MIKEMLSEDSGVSSMRVMSFLSLIIACLLALFGMYRSVDLSELAVLCGAFIVPAMGAKAVQKFAESKSGIEQ
jgi:lysylphosphatidylglycerol synthetase-like protein (DUF2156 family)